VTVYLINRRRKVMNKEAAIKAVDKIIQKSLARKGLFLCTMPIHEIVDAVIGELFGYKAKSDEDCSKCLFCRKLPGWIKAECAIGKEPDENTCVLWLTCPKPEKPKSWLLITD
jgi:hypothetical protein